LNLPPVEIAFDTIAEEDDDKISEIEEEASETADAKLSLMLAKALLSAGVVVASVADMVGVATSSVAVAVAASVAGAVK
jgi:hypothetical protein